MRSRLGRALERLIMNAGVVRMAPRFRRGDTLVLAYHNVVPEGATPPGESSLHLRRDIFAGQLDILCQAARIVPLHSLAEPQADGSGTLQVAITFDDAYRGALTVGVDELAKRGLPATVFASPGLLGDQSLWWDQLASVYGGSLPDSVRQNALVSSRGDKDVIFRYLHSQGYEPPPPPEHARTVTEDELAHVAGQEGFTVGSHSWGHLNLACLDPVELAHELQQSKRWLEDRFSSVIPWHAYPYGLASPAVERAAAEAGYVAALRVAGGWMTRGREPLYSLPRLNIPAGLSADGFRLRLAGLRCR